MSQAMIFRFAAVALAIGIGLGAFGAHGLRDRLSEGDLDVWKTGVQYQIFQALALMAVAALWHLMDGPRSVWGVKLVMAGMLVFSSSLYALVITGPRWLGAITPIGGVLMIVGWLLLASANFNSLRLE